MSDLVERSCMQAHGAPTGQGEFLVPASPHVNTEYCDVIWFGMSWVELLKATGEAHYADLAEKAALNALPGQRSKDGAISAYFSRPNQLFATRGWGSFLGTVYAAVWINECCRANSGRFDAGGGREHCPWDAGKWLASFPFTSSSTFRGSSTPGRQCGDRAGNQLSIFRDGKDPCMRPERPAAVFRASADTGLVYGRPPQG